MTEKHPIYAYSNKMILVIVLFSVVFAVLGIAAFAYISGNDGATMLATIMGLSLISVPYITVADVLPFVLGVAVSCVLNIVRAFSIRRTALGVFDRDALAATLYLKQQAFFRLLIIAAALLVSGWLHSSVQNELNNPRVINFMGVFFGIFAYPLANYSMRIIYKDAFQDAPTEIIKPESSKSTVQDTIDGLNAIGVSPKENQNENQDE